MPAFYITTMHVLVVLLLISVTFQVAFSPYFISVTLSCYFLFQLLTPFYKKLDTKEPGHLSSCINHCKHAVLPNA